MLLFIMYVSNISFVFLFFFVHYFSVLANFRTQMSLVCKLLKRVGMS